MTEDMSVTGEESGGNVCCVQMHPRLIFLQAELREPSL